MHQCAFDAAPSGGCKVHWTRRFVAAAAAVLGVASIGSAALAAPSALQVVSVESLAAASAHPAPARVLPPVGSTAGWKPIYDTVHHWVLPREDLVREAPAGLTIPFWTAKVVSPLDKKTYTTSMVGSSPYAVAKTNTVILYRPFIIKLIFQTNNGPFFIDPTQPGECDTESVSGRFFASPFFTPAVVVSNGVNVSAGVTGGTQVISAFQRANFWNQVKGTQYGVTFKAAAAPVVVTVNVPASSGSVQALHVICAEGLKYVTFGQIDRGSYDGFVQSWVAAHSAPNELPILLTYNTVLTNGSSCCILGYHGAFSSAAGTHTYSVGAYIDAGLFSNVADTSVWNHEMGEWLDDPFVQAAVNGGNPDDITPAWGHIGQVAACQNNLEVGDPLSGQPTWSVVGTGKFFYHLQDLAFHDWFYRNKSTSTGGKYSLMGHLTAVQGKCV
jgi:hypothetical protein